MYFIASRSRYTLLCGCRTLEESLSLSLSIHRKSVEKVISLSAYIRTYTHTHTRKTNQSSLTFELDEHKAHYVFVCRRNIIATSLSIYSENQTYNPKNVEETHNTQTAPDFVSLLTNRKILMVFCMRNVFTWHLRFELRM